MPLLFGFVLRDICLPVQVGYDFDDWTERMLSSYFFNGQGSEVSNPLDKLAFLLDVSSTFILFILLFITILSNTAPSANPGD